MRREGNRIYRVKFSLPFDRSQLIISGMNHATFGRIRFVCRNRGAVTRILIALLAFADAAPRLTAAETPLSFAKENTAADCAKSLMPEFSSLHPIAYLPDPFTKANGSRITTRYEWRCRRVEIKS